MEKFKGERYSEFRSFYNYQETDKEDIITTDEEIKQLEKLKEQGYKILLRQKTTGDYVEDWNMYFTNDYMYTVKNMKTDQIKKIESYLKAKYNQKEMNSYNIADELMINLTTVYKHLKNKKIKDKSFESVAEYIVSNT